VRTEADRAGHGPIPRYSCYWAATGAVVPVGNPPLAAVTNNTLHYGPNSGKKIVQSDAEKQPYSILLICNMYPLIGDRLLFLYVPAR
jgi:hypothetical protein